MKVEIKLNGEIKEFAAPLTVCGLLQQLNLNREGVAVALNRSVIPRADHATQKIQQGDAVEVIHAVGGGL